MKFQVALCQFCVFHEFGDASLIEEIEYYCSHPLGKFQTIWKTGMEKPKNNPPSWCLLRRGSLTIKLKDKK